MLVLNVGGTESYDEKTGEFIQIGTTRLELEHSLVAVSKWESEFERPFLGKDSKSVYETIAYIKHMVLTPDVPPEVFDHLEDKDIAAVNTYIDRKMTATWFSEREGQAPNRETITSELIYFWLVALSIPWDAQHWHLNRLLTLVRVANQKNQPAKKMSRSELAARNRQLNAARKAQLGTSG